MTGRPARVVCVERGAGERERGTQMGNRYRITDAFREIVG